MRGPPRGLLRAQARSTDAQGRGETRFLALRQMAGLEADRRMPCHASSRRGGAPGARDTQGDGVPARHRERRRKERARLSEEIPASAAGRSARRSFRERGRGHRSPNEDEGRRPAAAGGRSRRSAGIGAPVSSHTSSAPDERPDGVAGADPCVSIGIHAEELSRSASNPSSRIRFAPETRADRLVGAPGQRKAPGGRCPDCRGPRASKIGALPAPRWRRPRRQ